VRLDELYKYRHRTLFSELLFTILSELEIFSNNLNEAKKLVKAPLKAQQDTLTGKPVAQNHSRKNEKKKKKKKKRSPHVVVH
jgi:hypothetical protein